MKVIDKGRLTSKATAANFFSKSAPLGSARNPVPPSAPMGTLVERLAKIEAEHFANIRRPGDKEARKAVAELRRMQGLED
jgi:hypothetical protein